MMPDSAFSAIVRLKVRHARTAFARSLHFAGTDLVEDGTALDRAYQLYALILAAVPLALGWAFLAHAAREVFSSMGPAAFFAALRLAGMAAAAASAALCLHALRLSPLKLSRPDIAYVAASSVSLRLVAFVSFVPVAAGWALGGGALGYLAGIGAQAAGVLVDLPASILAGSFLCAAVGGAPWVVGAIRLSRCLLPGGRARAGDAVGAARRADGGIRAGRVRRMVLLILLALLLPFSFAAWALVASQETLLFSVSSPAALLSYAGIVAVQALLLFLFGARMDACALIRENALFADVRGASVLSPLDADAAREHRRRLKVAARRPRFRLIGASGRAALTARGALSLLRQPEGLIDLASWASCGPLLGALALSGAGGMGLLIAWVAATVALSGQAREVSRAFRDDLRVRVVRRRLPFSAFELLVFDSLPALALVLLLSAAAAGACAPLAVPHAPSLAVVALAVLVALALFFCCGLDATPSPFGSGFVGYEAGAALFGLVVGLASLAGDPSLTLGVAVCACLALALAARSSRV